MLSPVCSQDSLILKTNSGGELQPYVKAFQAAGLFHPVKITDHHPDTTIVEELKTFHFQQSAVPDLQKELPDYLAAVEGVSADIDILKR